MRKNQRIYDVMKKYGYDMAILSMPENVLHTSGMVTLPNIYAVGFFNWSLPLATMFINARDEKELLYVADSVEGDVSKYSFVKNVKTYHPYDLAVMMNPAEEYKKGFADAIDEVCFNGGKIAIEANLPHNVRREIDRLLPNANVCDVSSAIFDSKMIKADWELERMRKAALVVDAGFDKLNALSHSVGLNELDMWKDIFGAMITEANEHVQISGELVTGPRSMNSSYPGGPISRETQLGDVGIMDMSGRFDGYWCDCCNIVSFGKKNDRQRELFEVIYNAFEYTKAALCPGVTAREVYRAAEKAYKEKGYECPHYIGHSIGTGLNDMPKIIPCDDTVIEENMCFSMEPGIYKDNMGLRIEKMLLVNKNGCEEFNKFGWGVDEW